MSSIQDQAMLRRAKHAQQKPKLSAPVAEPSESGSGGNQISSGEYGGYDPVSDSYKVGDKSVKDLLTIDNIPQGKKMLVLDNKWGDY